MSFAKPELLLLLIALPFLALMAWVAWRKRGERWKKFVAPRLRKRLSFTRSARVHFTSLGLALLGLGGLIVAFAQPESGEEWIEVKSEGRNILFSIDISRSMLAEDVQPSRLQASRSAALEILERFPNDRVGVLLFAGEALIQAPLTLDHSFVEQTLAQLDPADIPTGGSNLTGAINEGSKLLRQSGQTSNIMVVFSDGEESTSGLEAAAEAAAKDGIFVYALGMGTSEGSFIPDARERDGKFRDRNGNTVFTRLDEEALRVLAATTEGFYSRGIGGAFLGKLDSALAEMDRFREDGKHQRVAKPAHQWFLLGGLLFLMISIFVRTLPLRPVVAAVVCFFALPRAEAGLIADGRDALERGEQMEAHHLFRQAARDDSGERAARLHLAAGSAAYQAKSWNAAADSFSEALQSNDSALQQSAHYALATSLFYLGVPLEGEEQKMAWAGAVKHYQSALEIDPADEKSRDNLKTVQALLNQKEKEKEKQEQEESKEQKDGENQDKEEKKEQDGQNQDQQDPRENEEKKPGEGGEDPKKQSNPENEPSEGDPKGEPKEEEGDPNQGKKEGEQPKPGEGEKPNPDSQPGEPKPGESPDDSKKEEAQANQMKEGEEPKNESREERARRLLKQYADFGGKAPRRIRRPFNRAAQDW
jgi:Ca-activated chloride channel family protein